MTGSDDLESRLAALIEHHLQHGELPPAGQVVPDRPDLETRLQALAQHYLDVTRALDGDAPGDPEPPREAGDLVLDGFRTIERLGAGGMGEVYKLQDLNLGRVVAGKVLRRDADGAIGARLSDFLHEAQSLALFSDPRVVQIFEFRADATPPVILMEFVDGFELGRIGPSLEYGQRAALLREVCDVLAGAHALGIQHRDLKPSNIMIDGQLRPKILDFGLSGGDPTAGHFRGTLAYIAPEQLDRGLPIDARTDVYALGVILYELLTGVTPYSGDTSDLLDAVRTGRPRLPVDINPHAPEPLQAIALKAMERRPADRYQSAREMARDLDRYQEGRPVAARPTHYATTLEARVRPHLDQVGEWLRLNLIYPHEALRLRAAYQTLEAREDDWIVSSRALTYSQILLYLGAFVLLAGSLFYFIAHRFFGAATGVVQPLVVLGAPFVGLNLAGRWLYRRQHQAVAVAFVLAGVSLLPLFLLIWFPEAGLFTATANAAHQLFDPGTVSNRQLQITLVLTGLWSGWLAIRTKTGALSTVSAVVVWLLALAVLADAGLRTWLEQDQFDQLALHLGPLVAVYFVGGLALERLDRPWFARPVYIAGALTLIAVLDLMALHGRAFEYLRISMRPLQRADVSDPLLLDTLAALTLNGVVFYAAAAAIDRYGTRGMAPAAQLLFLVAPFSMLEPLAWLSETSQYSVRFDGLYLAMAVGIALLSHRRQRRGFYYAGVVNTGVALYLIASRQQWFDQPSWAIALVTAGLLLLAGGFLLARHQRRPRPRVAAGRR